MDRATEKQLVMSARRRLLRGTFAMPAVAALHSGSAWAASSSLQCVQQQAASPIYPLAANASDMYLRVQLYQLWSGVPNVSGSTMLGWYLSGNSVEAARFGDRKVNNALLSAGLWKRVQMTNGLARLAPETLYAAPGTPDRLVLGPSWVALRVLPVRQHGWRVDIIGIVDGTTAGTAVTGSCWTSFAVM
jgi:hypothetical protein